MDLFSTATKGFYTESIEYQNLTKEYNISPSMSRAGTPIDNAPIKSFFSTLKTEWVYLEKLQSLQQAKDIIDEYIDFYN